MSIVGLIFLIAISTICLLCWLLAVSSLREKKIRACIISLISLFIIGLIGFGGYVLYEPPTFILGLCLGFIGVITIIFYLPFGKMQSLKIGMSEEQIDERDVIFAREEYFPGNEKYEKYYAAHPGKKEMDDKIRKLPDLLEPGGRYYDPKDSPRIARIFTVLESMLKDVDGPVSSLKAEINPGEITPFIKNLALSLGADEIGIARLNPRDVYSHVGRGFEKWGEPIINNHKYVIAFTLEMNYKNVEAAPKNPLTEESARKYLCGANISIALARYIRNLGYPARAHIAGSNYQIMLPPVAFDAGLGELGRMGYLISPKFGARVRLAAITTDLPLLTDKPINFGVQNFCNKCLKCVVNCPSGAIPSGAKTNARGVEKWQLNIEQCLYYWRVVGTDCGLCMKVCPYSHPPTLLHNLVRAGIKRSAFAQTVSIWGDDLLYGRKAKWEKI